MLDVRVETGAVSLIKSKVAPRRVSKLFACLVILPTLLAALYYGLIAADIYTSESRFMIKSPGKPVSSGIASLLVGGDLGGGADIGALREYATSRDALRTLDANGRVRQIYNSDRADLLSRLDKFGRGSFESAYEYYLNHISIDNENKSSVTVMRTQAFSPAEAQWINEQLLRQSEDLVNRLNLRSRQDTVRNAEADLLKARERAADAAAALAAYRDRYGIVDPDKQASIVMQMVSKLQDELIATRTLVAQTRRVAPRNPQIEVYQARASEIQKEIDAQSRSLTNGRSSLSGRTAEYTRLALENQFADRLLASAMASLESAKAEARRQQVYIERVAQPDLPDEATRPRRLRNIFAVFVVSLVGYGIVFLLRAALREHQL